MQVVSDKGRTEIRKVGLAPVVWTMISPSSSTSKGWTSLFDCQNFTLSYKVDTNLLERLNFGVLNERKQNIYSEYLALFDENAQETQNTIFVVTQDRSSKEWSINDLKALLADLNARNYKGADNEARNTTRESGRTRSIQSEMTARYQKPTARQNGSRSDSSGLTATVS